jgi:hypothetical protein
MATTWMLRMVGAVVMAIGLVAGSASAEDHVFNFSDEVKKGEERVVGQFEIEKVNIGGG